MSIRGKWSVILTIVIVFAQTSFCKEPKAFLTRLHGEWSCKELAFGIPATVTMKWAKTLNGKYTRLDYRIDMQASKDHKETYESVAYYRNDEGARIGAILFDTNGETQPIKATCDSTTLTSAWGTSLTKLGKTTYQFLNDSTVQVTDSVQSKDGAWKLFNQNTLTKKSKK